MKLIPNWEGGNNKQRQHLQLMADAINDHEDSINNIPAGTPVIFDVNENGVWALYSINATRVATVESLLEAG